MRSLEQSLTGVRNSPVLVKGMVVQVDRTPCGCSAARAVALAACHSAWEPRRPQAEARALTGAGAMNINWQRD